MTWKRIKLYPNQIRTTTQTAALIKMPPRSGFAGWVFWHPIKCIHEHDGQMTEMVYTEDFVFRLKRYGNQPYNKFTVQEQREITALDLEDAFRLNGDVYFDYEPELYKPPRIDPEGTVADEELIDDE